MGRDVHDGATAASNATPTSPSRQTCRAPQTWQVPRATFDHLLLRHAASSGVDVRERHRVLDVAFDDGWRDRDGAG